MDFVRRTANVLFAIGQALVPILGYAGFLGKTVDADYQVVTTPVVPATYAFTIWSVIFLFSLLYAIDQARPSRADDPIYRRIGWLTAVAFAVNTVWSVVAQLEISLPLTGIVFLVGFFSILPAAIALFGNRQAGADKWAAKLAVGLLAGWVSVAIYANWSVILKDAGLGDVPSETLQALLFLSAAGATAAFILSRTRGALYYAAAVLWALVALIVVNVERSALPVAIAAGVWILVIAGVTWFAGQRQKLVAG